VSEWRRDRESEFQRSLRGGRLESEILLARPSSKREMEREFVIPARLQLRIGLFGQHRYGCSSRYKG